MSLRHISPIIAVLMLLAGLAGLADATAQETTTAPAEATSTPTPSEAEAPATAEEAPADAPASAEETPQEPGAGSGDALDLALARGSLIVATELATPPWNFRDTRTKEPSGFVIELMEMFTAELGIGLEVRDSEWKDVLPALTAGSADMLPWISRTVPRSLSFMFSDSYVDLPAQALVRKGELISMAQLNNQGIVVGAKTGSIWAEVARRKLPKAKIQTSPTGARAIAALQAGKTDAYVNDKVQLTTAMQVAPGALELIPEPIAMDSLGAAVRFDSPKLLHSFNVFLSLIKIDGRFASLHKKWLGYAWRPAY